MFCQNCGSEVTGNFCINCGTRVGGASPNIQVNIQSFTDEETTLWEGQPSGIAGKMKSAAKINSTKYKITNQRIIVESGLIGKRQEEVELGRVKDYKVNQTLTEKLQNIGSIIVISTDESTPEMKLDGIESPMAVKEIIRNAVREYRSRLNIHFRENV